MPMPGAVPRSPASSCGRKTAETPSGAPIVNRRAEVEGSKGWAVAMTCLARAKTSATGAASSIGASCRYDALGRPEKQRVVEESAQAAQPVADRRRRKVEPLRGAADMPLLQNRLEQHEKVEVRTR